MSEHMQRTGQETNAVVNTERQVAGSRCGPLLRNRQHGVALIVALILLVVITLVGLAAVGGTIMQNKMAANLYDREVAFQASEAALRKAESVVRATVTATSIVPPGVGNCSVPAGSEEPVNYCGANPFDADKPIGQVVTVVDTQFNPGSVAAASPQYVIQYMGRFAGPEEEVHQVGGQEPYGAMPQRELADYYRITARSGDPAKIGDRAVVVLQETFRR